MKKQVVNIELYLERMVSVIIALAVMFSLMSMLSNTLETSNVIQSIDDGSLRYDIEEAVTFLKILLA